MNESSRATGILILPPLSYLLLQDYVNTYRRGAEGGGAPADLSPDPLANRPLQCMSAVCFSQRCSHTAQPPLLHIVRNADRRLSSEPIGPFGRGEACGRLKDLTGRADHGASAGAEKGGLDRR